MKVTSLRNSAENLKAQTALTKRLRPFLSKAKKPIGATIVAGYEKLTKASNDKDIDTILNEIDFSGWAVLVGPTSRLLRQVTQRSGARALAQIKITDQKITDQLDPIASEFAATRAAEMVGMKWVDGELVENPNPLYAITDGTRELLRSTISEAIDEGWAAGKLAKEIEDGYAFSPERSETIARTEIGNAHEYGNLEGWKASGVVEEKEWLDHDGACDDCAENAAAGRIPLDEEFPTGDLAPLAHPRCECSVVAYTTSGDDEE